MNSRILIVEDEGIVSLDIRETLENLGYRVVGEARTGIEAMDLAKEFMPDLILMDIKLHGEIDGIEAADRIYSLYDIPVIYLTSHSDESTLKRALKTNAFGYLVKPFNERELYSNIEMTIHKHRIMKKVEPAEEIDTTLTFVSDAVVTTGHDHIIKRINPAAESVTGWTREEAFGMDFFELFEVDKNVVSDMMEAVSRDAFEKRSLLSWVDNLTLKKKSGEILDISMNIGYVRGNRRIPDEFFFVLIPKGSDGDMKENSLERYYRIIMDAIDVPVYLIDSEMDIVIYNQAFSDLCVSLGVNLNHLDKPAYEVLPSAIFGNKWDYTDIFKSGSAFEKERTYKEGGILRYLSIETIPLTDGRKVTHAAVIVRDLTREKEIEDRDEMVAMNFRAHSKNVEEIADLCGLLKEPLSRARKTASSGDTYEMRKIRESLSEISDVLYEIDMKWLKYEKMRNFFDIQNSLSEDKDNSD
ncbi:response regulator [Methanoplanus sp. FWC-SCC4]|uniref:Response regulator n=1 Tax=Methanochimaera problematica TaxID=2609417 RepID=A0AA97FDM6_9EURY|nr:response regulator [Methanoplanus sp. FWC-SCC4]WOF17019.1 response regulator [Methanoplanus sp. FWC-SCC4]